MFAYCGNDPIINTDSQGMRHEQAAGVLGSGTNCTNAKKFVFANHVVKETETSSLCDYDFGPFGKFEVSASVSTQDKDEGFLYTYREDGSSVQSALKDRTTELGAGINIASVAGVAVGGNTDSYVFAESQFLSTSRRASIGISGVGYSWSINIESFSLNFDIEIGDGTWLLLLLKNSVPKREKYVIPIPVFF